MDLLKDFGFCPRVLVAYDLALWLLHDAPAGPRRCLCINALVAHRQGEEVSQDYTATGAKSGVSAYVYANHTVIEFDKEPSLAWVLRMLGLPHTGWSVFPPEHLGNIVGGNRHGLPV